MQQQVPNHHREMQQQVGAGVAPDRGGLSPLCRPSPHGECSPGPELLPTRANSLLQEKTLTGVLQPGPGPLAAS